MTSLAELARQAAQCTRCNLYRNATATVFGEGPANARLMLVGEQPGDVEDKRGKPFVGPAGRLLDRALQDSGVTRADAYLTNAVKHFKFTQTGKRRLHQPPNRTEIVACRPWLEEEISVVAPAVLVSLGAVAGSALIGPGFRVSDHRGKTQDITVGGWSGLLVATIHPSAVLRSADAQARDVAYGGLVTDLKMAATAAGAGR
ncbi:MAG: UdgX family uracil-DNA binding protein [Streptosporangiaceae bacterium]